MALHGFRAALEGSLLFILAALLSWLPMVLLLSIGLLPNGFWPGLLWLALFGILFVGGHRFVPARLKNGWFSVFAIFGADRAPSTHAWYGASQRDQGSNRGWSPRTVRSG